MSNMNHIFVQAVLLEKSLEGDLVVRVITNRGRFRIDEEFDSEIVYDFFDYIKTAAMPLVEKSLEEKEKEAPQESLKDQVKKALKKVQISEKKPD